MIIKGYYVWIVVMDCFVSLWLPRNDELKTWIASLHSQ